MEGAPVALLDRSLPMPRSVLPSCASAIIEHVQFSCQGLMMQGRDETVRMRRDIALGMIFSENRFPRFGIML
jgi:hypothetical protein